MRERDYLIKMCYKSRGYTINIMSPVLKQIKLVFSKMYKRFIRQFDTYIGPIQKNVLTLSFL
jgi:hypothetical protein